MSDWYVCKTGQMQFDQLHVSGLAILLATLTESTVAMQDFGQVYHLASLDISQNLVGDNLWELLWPLPQAGDLDQANEVSLAVFDGLLALLFTVRGPRLVSTFDATNKLTRDPEIVNKGLQKIRKALARVHASVQSRFNSDMDWITDLLHYYRHPQTQNFDIILNKNQYLSLLMTIDPAFSFASRQPISGQTNTQRHSVTLVTMPYAPFLAYLGASRQLRAQRVKDGKINFYVTIQEYSEVTPYIFAPVLQSSSCDSLRALLGVWLNTWRSATSGDWGISYQVLQTQGIKQSISVNRGFLEYQWLHRQNRGSGPKMIRYWAKLLDNQNNKYLTDIESLIDALSAPKFTHPWLLHFLEHTNCLLANRNMNIRLYHLEEVLGICMQMNQTISLKKILTRPKGTLRFGHALRQLGGFNLSELREITVELSSTATQDELLRTLANALQICVVAKARNDFVIIPDDEDLAALLEDIAEYGAREIAGLLIILSALRYPSREKEKASQDSTVSDSA